MIQPISTTCHDIQACRDIIGGGEGSPRVGVGVGVGGVGAAGGGGGGGDGGGVGTMACHCSCAYTGCGVYRGGVVDGMYEGELRVGYIPRSHGSMANTFGYKHSHIQCDKTHTYPNTCIHTVCIWQHTPSPKTPSPTHTCRCRNFMLHHHRLKLQPTPLRTCTRTHMPTHMPTHIPTHMPSPLPSPTPLQCHQLSLHSVALLILFRPTSI